jgi:hypothetical protein
MVNTSNQDYNYSENPTDQVDLEATLHDLGNTIEDEDLEESETAEIADDDVPQEYTESYGTGVQELPGYTLGGRTMADRRKEFHEATPELTGGDIDANYEQANAVGDESVGGTVNTPDMDIVDDLGRAVGYEMNDHTFLYGNDIFGQRDAQRWELEPRSSEDYEERQDDEF